MGTNERTSPIRGCSLEKRACGPTIVPFGAWHECSEASEGRLHFGLARYIRYVRNGSPDDNYVARRSPVAQHPLGLVHHHK